MIKTIKEWCEEVMLREKKTLKYTDKDGIVHTLTGNQPIYTYWCNPRSNAIMDVVSLNNGRSYHIDVKAYSSIIAHLVVNPYTEEVFIAKAMVTSSTDARILSEVADMLSRLGVRAWFRRGNVLIGGGPIMYEDFKVVAKLAGNYNIRHDRPLLRKGGYC